MKLTFIFIAVIIASVYADVDTRLEEKLNECAQEEFDIDEQRKKDIMYYDTEELQSQDEKCFLSCFMLGFEMMTINGTLNMERINQFISLVDQYGEREKKDVNTVGLRRVYGECDEKFRDNEENLCEAANDLRDCILGSKKLYEVKSIGESIWL